MVRGKYPLTTFATSPTRSTWVADVHGSTAPVAAERLPDVTLGLPAEAAIAGAAMGKREIDCGW